MEMTGDAPPLWSQRPSSMPHRRSPSPLFSPPVLIILLPIVALLLLFFAVPPFLSITTQIFRPYGVRKSWDSLNIFLVFFAILCGVLARRNDDDDNNNNSSSSSGIGNECKNNKPSYLVSQQWFDQYPGRKIYGDLPVNATSSGASVRRLKRSSSSYPDLRQEPLWENTEDRFRFFDDFEINKYRSSTNNYNDQFHVLRRSWRSEFEESEPKVISVDTFGLRSSPSSPPSKCPAPSTPPPPPPPPPVARHKPRRTNYQAVGRKEKVMNQNDDVEFERTLSPQPVTPPPPPPPPPRRSPSPVPTQMGNRSEQRYAKFERKKSNTATKEIKMVLASLRRRKKKHKTKDHDHHHEHDYPLHSSHEPPPYYSTTIPPPSPPPPPPPPPPSSVFRKYNLFRKGSKSKKIHSVPAPPPPPPPPPAFSVLKPSSKQNTQIPPSPPPAFFSTKSRLQPPSKPAPAPPTPLPEHSRRRTTTTCSRPPLPTKAITSIYYDENLNSGAQSPLIPMPPPPPPFKTPDFVFRGDFVNIRSNPSSRCSSPDLEEVDVTSGKDDMETVSMIDGDDAAGVGVSCPSPDVNAKAETFIARLRNGWKLEKINSMKEKQRI